MQIQPISINELGSLSTSSVFNSKEWISVYDEGLELLGIHNANGELIGCFYLYKRKRVKFLTQLSPPPYTPHCGLFYQNFATNPAKKHGENKKITKAISEYLQRHYKRSIVTLAFPPSLGDTQSFYWNDFKVIPNYTYQLDLAHSNQELSAQMDPKTRNLIKKAEKDGLTVEKNTDMNLVKSIVMQTMNRKGVTVNESILNNILFRFANETNSFSFVVKQDTQVLAITFCVMDNQKCYYLLGGYNKGNSHASAGPLGVYQSIRFAKQNGISIFDFEGSMIPNVESYFRSFGGKLIPYSTINKAPFVIESLLKLSMKQQF